MENITGRSEGVTRQLIPPPPPSFIHECILSYSTEEVQTRKQLERSFLQALVGLRDGIYTADPGSIDQRWGLWALNRAFPPVAMETSSNVSKHGKDLDQLQHLIPESAEFTEPSSNWAAEPNFNLSLASPRNPRQAAETFKLHGANKNSSGARGGGKPGGKGTVTAKTGRSASTLATAVMSQGERENPSLSRSSEEASLNSRGEQRLKSPNSKSTPTLVHTNSKTTAVPKLQPPPPPPPTAGSPRTTNREKTQVLGLESALRPKPAGATGRSPHLQTNRKNDGGKAMSQNSPSPKTLHPPVSPRVQNQGPDSKPANRSPAVAAKSRQRDPGSTDPNEKAGHDVRTLGSEAPPVRPRLQRAEKTLLSTPRTLRTPQPSSLSPKPSTHRKTSGPSSRHASGSNDPEKKAGLEDDLDPTTKSPPDSEASSNLKTSPSFKLDSSDSDVLPSSKPGPTCLTFNPSQVGPVPPSPPRTGISGSEDNKLKTRAESGPDPVAGSESSKLGPVLVSSRPSSAKRSPGSGPAERFLGLTIEVQSSGSAPGSGPLAPLATSSPKTRTGVGSTAEPAPEGREGTTTWGVTDRTGRSAGASLIAPSHEGGANTVTVGSSVKIPAVADVEREVEERGGSPPPSSSLHPLPRPSAHPMSSKTIRDSATMTEPSERRPLCRGEQREVGVQVEVEEHSTSFSLPRRAPGSSLIGSPSCQSGSSTSPAGQPPFLHVCKIDIELRSRSVLPSAVTDGLQRSPALQHNHDISDESVLEDEEQEKVASAGPKEPNEEEEDMQENGKPQDVAWDKQGMTWEVYGATLDLECLGTAIQSHLESKIREQRRHISSLRKSICSNSSLTDYRRKKRRKRRGGFLGCCRKAPAAAD